VNKHLLSGLVLISAVLIAGCTNTGQTAIQLDQPSYEIVSENIVNDNIVVDEGDMKYYQFSVPSSTKYASVSGTFSASGGSMNDINVLIMDEANFADWRSGRRATQFYESGKLSTGIISASLPSGTFYLVYSNTFSTFARKGVKTEVNLTYQVQVQ